MLRQMRGRWPIAALLSIAAAAVLSAPAIAASPSRAATSDLVAGPPSGSWTESKYTGPITVNDVYGSPTASAPGFKDAYRKSWDQTEVGLDDDLVHYTSVFWAAYALASFRSGAQKDEHTSYQTLSRFGAGAFEVTYPADSTGYKSDEIYFTEGDYMAAVSMAAAGSIARDVLLDQTTRQFALLPIPAAEFRSIGYGVLGGTLVVVLILVVMAASVVLVVIFARRRSATARVGMYAVPYGVPAIAPAAAHLSDDRRYWWDGQAWQNTAVRIPPWAPISPEGTQWWDGAAWRPMPSAGGGTG
jgi:hypothetical protein